MFCQPAFEFMQVVLANSPLNYLEIGIYNGDSIAQLGTLNKDKKIFAVDPFIEDGNTSHNSGVHQGESLVNQKESSYNLIKDLENVKIFEMTSKQFLQELTPTMIEELNVGCVLIDGSHHYDDVVLDGILALSLIASKSGIVIFDDVNLPDVNRAHNEWTTANKDIIAEKIELTPHIIAYRIN